MKTLLLDSPPKSNLERLFALHPAEVNEPRPGITYDDGRWNA